MEQMVLPFPKASEAEIWVALDILKERQDNLRRGLFRRLEEANQEIKSLKKELEEIREYVGYKPKKIFQFEEIGSTFNAPA